MSFNSIFCYAYNQIANYVYIQSEINIKVGNTFQTRSNELTERFADPEDEYYLQGADTASLLCVMDVNYFYQSTTIIIPVFNC